MIGAGRERERERIESFGGNFWGKSDKTERERQGKFVQIGQKMSVFGEREIQETERVMTL